jgi:hypothetical protein
MNDEVQYAATIGIVGLASTYVLWTVVARFWSRDKSCGSACSGCGANEKTLGEPKAFVGIESLSQSPKQP